MKKGNEINNDIRIGVLALQGCVEPHRPHVLAAGAAYVLVKTVEDIASVDGFILPGGESTTMLRLIENFQLWEPLRIAFAAKPVWGICAGAILMAATVTNPEQKSFGLLPITVQRNGYGRQLDSKQITIHDYPVSFIRAPIITSAPAPLDIQAQDGNHPVWVSHGAYMATTFHPELTRDFPSPMHRHFVDMVRAHKGKAS